MRYVKRHGLFVSTRAWRSERLGPKGTIPLTGVGGAHGITLQPGNRYIFGMPNDPSSIKGVE